MTPEKRERFALIDKLDLMPDERAYAISLEEMLEAQIRFWTAQVVRVEVIRSVFADQVESMHLVSIGRIQEKQRFSIIDGTLTEPSENAYARSLALCLFHQVKHIMDHTPAIRIEVIAGAFAEALDWMDFICRNHPCPPPPTKPPPSGGNKPA